MIELACQCGRQLQAESRFAGRQVRCPACKSVLRIPGTAAADTNSIADVRLQTRGPLSADQASVLAGSAIQPDQKFSHYVIKRRLGAGAMGEVWLAFDTTLERELAIKILPPSLGEDQERLLRFFREARLAAQLNHPNTVTIYQVGVEEGLPFLAMELVDGGSLEDKVRQHGPLAWQEATCVIRDAALGLAEAHALGLVHRDIKPANLLQSSKAVTKVADFGLARATRQESSLTSAGAPLGTPAYMPPEQWKGETVDGRSDLYSLICTYYFLLTGKPPYDAPSAPALGYQHSHVPFPNPKDEIADLPDAICRIIARGTQKSPDLRYQAAGELVADLDAALAEIGDGSVDRARLLALSPNGSDSRGQDRRRRKLVAAGAASTILCGVLIYITSRGKTTKIEIDDPDAAVRVERSEGNSGGGAEAAPITPAGTSVAEAASDLPTFDDFAAPPPPPVWLKSEVAIDPIPEAALVQQAEEKIRAEFKDRLSQGKLEDNDKLADELLRLAATGVHQPAERFAQLRLARTMAVEAENMTTALLACDKLAASFDVDAIRMKTAVLAKCVRPRKGKPPEQDAYTNQCFLVGFQAIGREDYRYVEVLCRLAKSVAEDSRFPFLQRRVNFMAEEGAAGKKGYQRIRPLADKLRGEPDDPEANRAAGAFLCLVKNDWPRGIAMLKRGDDPELAEIAEREQANPTTLDLQAALGDAWWELATKMKPGDELYANGMRRRARHWYLKALGQQAPSERAELARRLQPRIDAVPVMPIALRIRMPDCDGPHVLEITNDRIETKSNRWGTGAIQINHMSWNHDVRGHFNTGAGRLLPSAVDFGSAHVVREVAGRWGWITFQIEPDRFVLIMGHGPSGRTSFDVAVAFGADGFTLANRFEGLWQTKFYKWNRANWKTANGIQDSLGWEKLLEAGPVETRTMDRLNYRSDDEPWDTRGKPLCEQVGHDFYAVVADSTWNVPAGDYEVVTHSDDGIRVFIDEKKVIDRWVVRGKETDRATVTLSEAPHRLRVEYFQFDKHERLQFYLRRLGGD